MFAIIASSFALTPPPRHQHHGAFISSQLLAHDGQHHGRSSFSIDFFGNYDTINVKPLFFAYPTFHTLMYAFSTSTVSTSCTCAAIHYRTCYNTIFNLG